MLKERDPEESKQQLEHILVLSQQEKTITHIRNLIHDRNCEIKTLRRDGFKYIVKFQPGQKVSVIADLRAEVKSLKEMLFKKESQLLIPQESLPRLHIQLCCTILTVAPVQPPQEI